MIYIKQFVRRLSGWVSYRSAKALASLTAKIRLKRICPSRVLILCYGNIYRSPFVEFYLRSMMPEVSDVEIRSAGFHQVEGRQSSKDYIEHCRNWGIDLSAHRSKKVDKAFFDWAQVIVIMDGHNYNLARMLDPGVSNRLIWLGALSGQVPVEIPDPYGKPTEQQQKVVEQLAAASRCLVKYL